MAEKSKPKKKRTTKKSTASKSKKAPVKKSASKKVEQSDKYAVVEVGGSQLLVKEGEKYEIDRLEGEKGEEIVLDKVLFLSEDNKVKVGKPYLDGASVKTVIDSQKKGKKMRVFKYKAKSRYRKTYGHRDHITRLLVTQING